MRREGWCIWLKDYVHMYHTVDTLHATNATKAPLHDKHNAVMSEKPAKPWWRNGEIIGSYVETSTLTTLPGLGQLESAVINPNKLRQLAAGQMEGRRDIGDFYVISNVGGVWLFKDPKSGNKWAKQIDPSLAPSLVWIDAGRNDVSLNYGSVVSSQI